MVVTQSERDQVLVILSTYRGKHSTLAVSQIMKELECMDRRAENLFRDVVRKGLARVDGNFRIQIKGVDY